MKKIFIALGVVLLVPFMALAKEQAKVFTGTVTAITDSQITVKTNSGLTFRTTLSTAPLLRKNGNVMQLNELLVGDKVEVKGTVYSDNSFLVSSFRDLSLYAHNGTFSGKIVNVKDNIFTLQTNSYGLLNVHTDTLTAYKVNSSSAKISDIKPDMSATVKGVWERSRTEVFGKSVDAKLRLVSVEFTGTLFMKSANAFTVVVGNTIYAVDVSSSKFVNKSGKSISWDKMNVGDNVKVTGKHLSGNIQVIASLIKDVSLVK